MALPVRRGHLGSAPVSSAESASSPPPMPEDQPRSALLPTRTAVRWTNDCARAHLRGRVTQQQATPQHQE
ncbi:MAG: hypothetical protein JWQ68_1342 [Cryobacterium sp.]|nr:hypothetical protein [Cryobacterium sp.]